MLPNAIGCDRFWHEDPLPMPPAAFGTATYWRWLSARTLARRKAVA